MTIGSPTNIGTQVTGRCWLVIPDNWQQLAPIGTIGEILIEGPHVARGYLNDIQKTNAVFVERPDWLQGVNLFQGGQNCYLTGDLAYYEPDGSIVYVGRKDAQVKIHGQRVELGEVEYHLQSSFYDSGITFAVDIIRLGRSSDALVLTAFVHISDADDKGRETDIPGQIDWTKKAHMEIGEIASNAQSRLGNLLPSYMIPSVYIPLRGIPRTASGKTDRRQLQQLALSLGPEQLSTLMLSEEEDNGEGATYTEMEKRVQQLWISVLKATRVGLADNFFGLGGDSVKAMQLVSAARNKSLLLTVADIFRCPTLKSMASSITCSPVLCKDDTPAAPSVPFFALIKPDEHAAAVCDEAARLCNVLHEDIEDIYPCTALQEGLLALSAQRPGAYIAQQVIKLPSNVNFRRFQAAWQSVAESTPIIRTRIVQTESRGCFQVVLKHQLNWEMSNAVKDYLKTDKDRAMGFGTPLCRYAHATDVQNGPQYFIWTVHHALYDGWSLPLILEKVEAVYNDQITQPTACFRSFIKYLIDRDAVKAESFWVSYLEGFVPTSPFLSLSPDRQSGANDSIVQDVAISRKSYPHITTSTLIHGAWSILLSQYSETDDVIFGATLSGRNASVPEIELMLGPTIATVPIRVQVNSDGKQLVATLLESIQENALLMMPYEHTGLQKISGISPGARAACGFQHLLVINPHTGPKAAGNTLFADIDAFGDLLNFYTYPLTIECQFTHVGIQVTATYDSALIESKQMQRILHQFSYILRQLSIGEPGTRVCDIEITSLEDKEEIFNWNHEMPTKVHSCIHHSIEKRMYMQPDAIAVHAWDGELTYHQLNDMSSKLAQYLTSLGVGPETFVPLCFEKSMVCLLQMET